MEMWKYSLAALGAIFCACERVEIPINGWGEPASPNDSKAVVALSADATLGSLAVWIASGIDTVYVSSAGNGVMAECRADLSRIFVAGNIATGASARPDTLTANLANMTDGRISCSATFDKLLGHGLNEFPLSLPRDICKISLEKVENRISEGAYSGKTVTVEKVFIINGVGRFQVFCMNGEEPRRWWFAPSGFAPDAGWEAGAAKASPEITAEGTGYMNPPGISKASPGKSIGWGLAETIDIELYTGPNDVSEDAWGGSGEDMGSGQWTPRKTRLVLQCLIDGHRCYYPLTIDNLKANHHYIVRKMVLTRFGTEYPDQPYDFTEAGASIVLADWNGVPVSEII
ncbi:MAG: hypothetical protein IJ151_03325 [Bacteroidales bacterium]|nr:hypothetical protein [Bacteroidales bacterium]